MASNEGEKSSGGGFFGAIKGALFEETPGTAPVAAPVAAPVIAAAPPRIVAAEVDPQVRAVLERDVGEAAKPAYSEFLLLSQSLAAVLPDESLRFKAVLAALASKGHTIQQVMIDIDESLAAVAKKEGEMQKAAAQARASRVGTKETEIARLKQEVINLQAEIEATAAEAAALQAEVTTEMTDIEATEARVAGTVAAYRRELTDLKNKITPAINGAR